MQRNAAGRLAAIGLFPKPSGVRIVSNNKHGGCALAIINRRSVSNQFLVFICFSFFFILITAAGPRFTSAAPATADPGFASLLHNCLEPLWTGRDAPDQSQQQLALKGLIATGLCEKDDLEAMMAKVFLTLLGHQKTSRYLLPQLPRQIAALCSPLMTPEDVERTMWRAVSTVIQKDDPVRITIGTLAPPGTPWITVPETTAIPKMERLSEGKVLIKIYSGGVMGEDTDILDKMRAGQIDGCGCTALGVLAASPEASVLLLPGLFKSYDEVDYICKKFRKRLDKAFEQKGYILASLIDTGHFYLFSKNRCNGLADLPKQHFLSWFGTIEMTLYQGLGIESVPVAVPDVASAFSAGQADAMLAPAAWMLGMQVYQYTNFYLTPPLLFSPTAVFVTNQTRERIQQQLGLSDQFAFNVQELIVSEITAIETEWNRQIRNYEEKSLKAFENKCGMKAMTFTSEDRQAIEKISREVQEKLSGKIITKELRDDISRALTEYRSINKK